MIHLKPLAKLLYINMTWPANIDVIHDSILVTTMIIIKMIKKQQSMLVGSSFW